MLSNFFYGPPKGFFRKCWKSKNTYLYDIGWRYRNFHRGCLKDNSILHFLFYALLFIKFTVYEKMRFFEFFILFFLNRNKTILVEDTLNLMAHSIKEIKFSIFFIRDTFLIWLTVYEILRVFWEHGCQKHTRFHILSFH